MNKEYNDYISSSSVWALKRAQRLHLDNNKCVVCKHDGSEYRLEVHHLHYKNFGNEDVLYDLVTACARCHPYLDDVRKARKYAARSHKPTFVAPVGEMPGRHSARKGEIPHGMADTSLQVDFIGSTDYAQRADSRPPEQMVTGDQDYFRQARQVRR
jgi:hypothetical protein